MGRGSMGSKIWIIENFSSSIKVCVSFGPRWSFGEERKTLRSLPPQGHCSLDHTCIWFLVPSLDSCLYFRVVIIRKFFQLEESSSLSRYLRFLVTPSVYKQRPDINPGGGLTEEEEKAIRRKRIQEVRSSMIIGKTLKWSKIWNLPLELLHEFLSWT